MPVKMQLARIIISELTENQVIYLQEVDGNREFPILIGIFEATNIDRRVKDDYAPQRPLTHDLFKTTLESFDARVTEVIIYNMVEGVFFAKLICASGSKEEEIDCRPSDAVALAYRFGCPIYCEEEVLKLAGIGESEIAQSNEEIESPVPAKPKRRKKSLDALKNELAKAIAREDYEQASRLRDEIEQRQEN